MLDQRYFKKPIVCLAPMDGVTDMAYRQIVRRLNKDVIVYSEFTSIDGIKHSRDVRKRLDFVDEEIPYFVQLFGNDPKLFAETVKQFEDEGVTGIDINMGCPAKKIVNSMHGSGLMKEPDLACRIVEACSNAVNFPITVKTRLGWQDASSLIPFIQSIVGAGAKMIAIHGRTYKQAYRGEADWEPIYELKKNIPVPLIGNGDVKDFDDGVEKQKNLDGFMIGRCAIGNPWAFWNREKLKEVTLKDKVDVVFEHYQLLRKLKPERKALIEFRKHIAGYITGFKDAKYFRTTLMQADTEKSFIERLYAIA